MESLRNFILSLCGSTMIVSLCKILLSNSKIKKTTNVFFSVFVLLYTILPIINYQTENSEFSIIIDEKIDDNYYESGYEAIIVSTVNRICETNNIEVISIDVNSYIENDYIVIEQLSVTIKDKSKIYETESLLKESGFEVSVN